MSKSEYERQSHFELKYTRGGQGNDALFGEHFIYTQKETNSKIICVEKLYNDRQSLNRSIEDIKKKILNKHDYILNLLDYSVEVQKNWCSTFYLLRVFFEYPDKSLKQIILEKKQNSNTNERDFKTDELTHLLYHQISVNSYLQENGIPHGDITPNTIFRSNKGEFKLAFRNNTTIRPEKVQLEKMLKREPIYISPSIYSSLKKRDLDNIKHIMHKSDIYSLGLCILEAGLMHSIQNIYDNNDQINQNLLDNHLNEFEEKYEDNPLLFTSVRKMLEFNEEDRADFISLKEAMPEYEVICDYFYKLEHGLIDEEEEYDESFDDLSPGNQKYAFAPNQNFEVPPQDFYREKIHNDSESQSYYDNYNGNFNQNNQLKVNAIPNQNIYNPVTTNNYNKPTQEIKQNPIQNQHYVEENDFFDVFSKPTTNNNFVQNSPPLENNPPSNYQSYQSNPYSQPQKNYQPQTTPSYQNTQQTNSFQNQSLPQTNYSNYQQVYQPPQQNQYFNQPQQSYSQNNEIKMINGVPHKVVNEIIDDVDEDGYLVQKNVIKYVALNQPLQNSSTNTYRTQMQPPQQKLSYTSDYGNKSISTNPNTTYTTYSQNNYSNTPPQYIYH